MTKEEKYYLFKKCRNYRVNFHVIKSNYGLDNKLTAAAYARYSTTLQIIYDLGLKKDFYTWEQPCNERGG